MRVYTKCDFHEPSGEHIDIAAIQCGERTFTGGRHRDIVAQIQDTGLRSQPCIDGFMTSQGRFVDRKEAARIAYEAGQIPEPVAALHSEDIY
jgi:hypothetical protein